MSKIVNCEYSKTIMEEPVCNAFDVNRHGEIICSEESCIILKLKEQLQAKEQECEELKQWKKDAENLFKTQTDNADKIINRYKQALDKIWHICLVWKNPEHCEDNPYDLAEEIMGVIKPIKNSKGIINKAKEDNPNAQYNRCTCGSCRGREYYRNMERLYENAITVAHISRQDCQYFKTQFEYFKDLLVESENELRVKEQECEKLKLTLQASDIAKAVISSANIHFPMIEKLSTALDEIEQICNIKKVSSQYALPNVFQQILDIINKAKDSKNA